MKGRQLIKANGDLSVNPELLRCAQVCWTINGREYLADVVRCYQREFPYAAWMLQVKHFNGEPYENDIALGAVEILEFQKDADLD